MTKFASAPALLLALTLTMPQQAIALDWNAARSAAEGMSLGGVSGYLATITSQQEQDFILSSMKPNPPLGWWLGGNRVDDPNVYKWMTGPEAGQAFWQGDGYTGVAVNGAYNHWDFGAFPPQPNGPFNEPTEIYLMLQMNIPWNNLSYGYWGDDHVFGHRYGSIVEFSPTGSVTSLSENDITDRTSQFFNRSNGHIYAFVGGAVPEPETWAFMILGFAGVGYSVRASRRRRGPTVC
jgi:hypothetical protein